MQKTTLTSLLLFIAIGIPHHLKSQVDSTDRLFNWNVSYFGNMAWTPGLKIGAEYTIWEKEKVKTRKEKEQRKLHRFYLDGNLGFYVHPKNHTGLFNTYGINYRKTTPKLWNYYIGSGIGIYRSFLPETYTVNENGDVDRVFLPGAFYFSPGISFGFGKNYDSEKIIKGWFVQSTNLILKSYNTTTLPLLNLEIGLQLNLKK